MKFEDEEILISNGKTPFLRKKRLDILEMIKAAVAAVDPYHVVSSKFQDGSIILESKSIFLQDFTNIYLVAFGKASIGMTRAVIDACSIKNGVVITNDSSQTIDNPNVKIFYGGHPLPNQGSINGTKAVEEIISKVTDKDLLIILISGGGSALLCHPRVSLEDMQKTTSLLLKSGATIQEINTVRKHISHVKGGQLIKQLKGTAVSLIISDVIDDPLGFISSGPSYFDETTYQQSYDIFQHYQLWNSIPPSVQSVIRAGLEQKIEETPDETNPIFQKITNEIVANNTLACQTLYNSAKSLGYHPFIYSTSLQGEASITGNRFIDVFIHQEQSDKYDIFIAGGETTVTVTGDGKGGRNQEIVLASLEKLEKNNLIFASFGTDGIDGMSTAAGALADEYSYQRSKGKNLNVSIFLRDNNSNAFFKELHDLLITGPTGTNVMDIQILMKTR